MTNSEQTYSDRVKRLVNDSDRIEVVGPAITRRGGLEHEIVTGISLRFPADTEVWIKVWPEGSRS